MPNEFYLKYRPFDKVETNRTCSVGFDFVEIIVRLVAFDNVTSTLSLVWTGLNDGEVGVGKRGKGDESRGAIVARRLNRYEDYNCRCKLRLSGCEDFVCE